MAPCGLQLRRGLEFDDWIAVGRQILRLSSASAWWLGDWLVYGERAFDQRYERALQATPLDYQTLRNYAWVARRVALSRRRDTLSFQHHAEVAALPPAEQEMWLERAAAERWSRNELRRRLAAARGEEPGSRSDGVVLRIEVAQSRERQWREAAGVARQRLSDWVAAAADDAARAALAPHATSARRPASRGPRRQARATR